MSYHGYPLSRVRVIWQSPLLCIVQSIVTSPVERKQGEWDTEAGMKSNLLIVIYGQKSWNKTMYAPPLWTVYMRNWMFCGSREGFVFISYFVSCIWNTAIKNCRVQWRFGGSQWIWLMGIFAHTHTYIWSKLDVDISWTPTCLLMHVDTN